MADSDNESGDNGSSGSERDRFLPIANVSRIMKKALPANAKITKEAKETVQMCASEFISFITGEASAKCLNEKRKTINGDDLLEVMSILGFDNYIGPLKLYLKKFRELKGDNQGIGTSAAGGGGSASSSSSQPTDVLGGEGNVGGSYGADLYGTGIGGAGSGGSGMMVMGQQLYGVAGGGGSASSSSSQPTGVLGGGYNVGGSYGGIGGAGSGMMVMGQQLYGADLYGADLYGTGIGGSGSGGSGMMVMGQQLYGVAGGGGYASSSSSQPTDVLGEGCNVGGSYGADLYGTDIGGSGSGGSGMMVMGQQLYGVAGGGGSASSSSSQPTNVLWGGANVGGSYGADLYGTGIGGAGSDMMVMGQQLYGGSPTSGSLDQHQQHQLGSGLFRGSSGGGSGGGFDGSSSPSGRQGRM